MLIYKSVEIIKSLKKTEIEKLGVSHCTGMNAGFRLYKEFGDRFFFLKAPSDISYQGLSSDRITFSVISLNLRILLP